MRSGVDTLLDLPNWQKLYGLLPDGSKSPYFSPQYQQAYTNFENCEVKCFWSCQDEANFLFYPFLVKSINSLGYELEEEYYDISGAYGYNGPLGVTEDSGFLTGFNQDLLDWIHHNRIVTEFVRYCPITDNRRFHTYTDQIEVLDNVYLDISRGSAWVWENSFEYRVRKTVRKGESYGLRTVIHSGGEITVEDLEIFQQIYHNTMTRNSADDFYFFGHGFLSSLVHNLGEMIVLSLTYHKDKPVSTELVLKNGSLAFGFLGGTLADYYAYKPNTFQRWELVKYLCGIGLHKYSIGGGATRGDGIYKFKKSFARNCESLFHIGTKVHEPEVYAEIQQQLRETNPRAAEENLSKLQGYRIQI